MSVSLVAAKAIAWKSRMRDDAAVQAMLEHFSNPDAVKHYAEGPPRFVPGFADLHRMTGILLAEQTPQDARVLVLGAGGGLELKALAEAEPGWTFVGVDPAAEMLKLAERTLGPLTTRVGNVRSFV
jgi:tRNA (cmo5U34)-methyltransferase